MSRRFVLALIALAALLAAAAVIWPRLAAEAKEPRIGDWYPELDPGTLLVVDLADRHEEYGLGRHYHYHEVELAAAAVTGTEVQVCLPGGGVTSSSSMESPTPTRTSNLAGSGGYLQHTAPHLARFTLDVVDAGQLRRTLHAPIRLPTSGAAIGPSDLVVADDLDLQVRWRTTPTELVVELVDADGDGDPGCARGTLQCDGLQVPFTAAPGQPPPGAGRDLAAALPLTGLGDLVGYELNVRVELRDTPEGERELVVTVKLP